MNSPYIVGGIVANTPCFVGRTDILEKVKEVLDSQQNTIVLVGNRRIGKTSILRTLETELLQGDFIPFYFDLEDKYTWSLNKILQVLAYGLSNSLNIEEPNLGNEPQEKFRQWLYSILKQKKLVLLIDEFDTFTDKNNNTEQQEQNAFFPYLRDLLSLEPQRLNFVFTMGRRISDLKIVLSLFKASVHKRVSLLNETDTNKIISFSEGALNWQADAKNQVWQLTHGHPYLTQGLCSEIWYANYTEQQNQAPIITLTKVNKVIPETLESVESAMEWLWDGLGTMERLVASALAEAGAGSISETQLANLLSKCSVPINLENQRDAASFLLDWDLIEPTEERDGYRFRVELLRRWIEKKKPLSEQQRDWEKFDQEAYNFFQAAQNLYDAGECQGALNYLRQAVNKNPDHIRANKLLAKILLEQNQIDEACEVLEQLRKYQPQFAHPLLVKAWLKSAETSGSFKEQLEFYEKVLEIDPKNQDAKAGIKNLWQIQAEKAYRNGELEKALEFYQKAEVNEKAAQIQIEIWQKQADEAYRRDDLNTALELYQKAGVNEKVAEIQQKMEIYTKPIAEFEAAINEIIEASKARLTGIFLYEITDNIVFYDSQNSTTSKKNLHNLLLKQQASKSVKMNSFDASNLKEALDFFGEQAQCGELKQVILQTSNDIRVVYFSEKTVAIGFISSMGLGQLLTFSKRYVQEIQNHFDKLNQVFGKNVSS